MLSAGKRLRELREQLGLTLRDVELASTSLANTRGIDEFIVNPSRLSDIETKGVVPSIYRLYVLSVLYRTEFADLLKLYGVDLNASVADFNVGNPARTHRLEIVPDRGVLNMPVKMDPGFDLRRTTHLGRMIEEWGVVPVQFLQNLVRKKYTYGYIGLEDMTMYPLLMPGCFVQVDEEKTRVDEGPWRAEYERPIYFVETRNGFLCSWCTVRRGEIVLQSHPLSPVTPRILKHPQEAEVAGQVVGIAMRLASFSGLAAQERPQNLESGEGEPREVRRR